MAGLAMVVALFLVPLALLTGIGSARRNDPIGVVIASALGFPIACVAWYVEDNPNRHWRRFASR